MVMWVAAPRMKRKRKPAVMGMSMFFLGMPPRVQMAGRHGPELDWEMLGYMLEWMVFGGRTNDAYLLFTHVVYC